MIDQSILATLVIPNALMPIIAIVGGLTWLTTLMVDDGSEKIDNITQKRVESFVSLAFTSFRICITTTICLIFLIIDYKILAFITTINLTTIDFTPENLKVIKYAFLFLVSQLVIFSQGFRFSSIVKLMERFSSKKNAKEVEMVKN
jgi:hypothetical protein